MHASSRSGGWKLSAFGGPWAHPVLWGAYELRKHPRLSLGGWSAAVAGSTPQEPEQPTGLEAHGALHQSMTFFGSNLPPIPFGAFWRNGLRQEPDAVVPHVRICGGGQRQP